ncbi:MAG: 4-hydroxy-tetrahydrodipicolinate synthase [Pseudomonadota bacterium]
MANQLHIFGSITALVTPFKDGAVDDDALRGFVKWQIAEGTNGLVPVGTTGESPTLSHTEHRAVTEAVIEAAAGAVPVIAGCGSNSTAEAIDLMRHAETAGADAALIVCPYYNKPSQQGLYDHFKALADASSLPIVIYNIPGRSIVDMQPDTMAKLAEISTVIGVKDATGDAGRVSATRAACGPDFIQLSGNDDMTLGMMAMGAHGAISVTSNVAPALCAQFQKLVRDGAFSAALEVQDKLYPLHRDLFCEPSPAPAKYGLSLLGQCQADVRLPITPLTDAGKAKIKAAMAVAGLL